MDRAKAAVSEFMHKTGHHDTTVHEKVAPAVVSETVKKTRHDEVQTAVDREVHQDHYHTTVQPIKDREVLPEAHKHTVAAVQERHVDHGSDAEIRRRLEEERARFHDTRIEAPTVHTQSTAPTVAGEHVHHHVHETIQPVLQKEVIQPTVVHTTVPIHEVHHNQPVHHTASALPAVSLGEYQRQGGTLSGRDERIDGFEGEPKAVSSAIGGTPLTSTTGITGTGTGAGTGHHSTTGTGHHSSTGTGHHSSTGTGHHSSTGITGTGMGHHSSDDRDRTGYTGNSALTGNEARHIGTDGPIGTSTSSTAPQHKSNLLNKLDPRVDSNNDGKAGFGK